MSSEAHSVTEARLDMTKPPAPEGVQRLHNVGARLAPLGKWPLEAAFLGWYPGQRTEHRQPLQRTSAQSYSGALTCIAVSRLPATNIDVDKNSGVIRTPV